jgi:CHASE2 domain-containing sensor protein/nitrogen-specific signal transduction histidine kinase
VNGAVKGAEPGGLWRRFPGPASDLSPLHRWRDEIAIATALGLMAVAMTFGGWAWRLERVVYDAGLALWSRPAPPDIVIVAIDDDSIDAIGRWPWRRAVHASVVERLAQAQPKAVALDFVLSEADPDVTQDQVLARAMSRSVARGVPVVVPVAWEAAQAQPLVPTKPAPELGTAMRQGAAEAPVDADGVLRHAFLRAGPAAAPYPHLALALMQAAGEGLHPRLSTERSEGARTASSTSSGPGAGPGFEISLGGPAQQRWRREDRFLIRYAGAPGTVERVSFVDVLRGSVPAQRFAGSYVLVGMTAQGLGDTLATPVNGRHQAMPGVEALANVLYTLRSGDTIETVSDSNVAAISAALLVALVLSFGVFGPRRALPTAVVAVPLAVMTSLWALRLGHWFSPVSFALPAILAYPLWSWRRLERAVAGLDEEIARLAAEPLVAATVLEGVPSGPVLAAGAAERAVVAGGDAIAARLQTLQRAGTVVRQARRFLSDTLTALPTAMLVADERTHVLLANPKAAALFEVDSAEELQGLDLARLLAEFTTDRPFDWPAAVDSLQPNGAGIAVEGTLGQAGSQRHDSANASAQAQALTNARGFVVHLAAVDLQGQHRLIVSITDVEPVKQAQREREEALAFVSHDLRSPASSIVLLADLNLRQQPVAAPQDLLLEMRRLAVRTLALSEEFVRAAQVQTLALQRAAVTLPELLDDALADLRAQAQAAAVVLHTHLPTEPAAGPMHTLVLDRALVSRAIANLVSNAIKHSPHDSNVHVSAHLSNQRLVVGVRDQGPGLSAEQLAQLAQGDRGAVVRDARGIGLGLLFVQRVARRHGGSLRALAPADGAGALFELDLPSSGNP